MSDTGDHRRVAELLGREPRAGYRVVVRDASGDPLVIRNDPLLEDGTPMPTLYWLVGPDARRSVDRLEAAGGVRRAEAEVDRSELRRAHAAYASERDGLLPAGWTGPVPSGGVGGTRAGVKCLHAHYAWWLAGGDDPVGRWVARQLSGPVAAVDCGTNSTRLLVAGADAEPLERLMTITRLGEGVDRTRRLSAAGIERTVSALRRYRVVMDRLGVTRVRITATSAARDASNSHEFFSAAEAVIGARPELLSGDEEGKLSFAGATAGLDRAGGPWLVTDIGGGSTELIAGPGPDGGPTAVTSLDVGCVRVTERDLAGDPPSSASLAAARGRIADLLAGVSGFEGARVLVGLAGTVACLAAVDQGLGTYDRDRLHHYALRRERVEEMLAFLAARSAADRRGVPGVEEGRADVIVGGALVLAEIMRHFGFDSCLTSEADILDGLAMSLLGAPQVQAQPE